MRKAVFVFAVAWRFRQAVLAAPAGTDIVSSHPATPVETHGKYWASYMKAKGYPSNEAVCNMIRNKENDLFSRSGGEDYYRIWMIDNGFIMDDWVQQLYLNATADAGTTTGNLGCTALDSKSCRPPQEGVCERYNPAGFHIIHTGIISMYTTLQAVDISDLGEIPLADLDLRTLATDFIWRENDWQNRDPEMSAIAPILFLLAGLLRPVGEAGLVTELVATEEPRVGTIGSFQLNTVARCLSLAAKSRRGGYIDISRLAHELPTEISSVFDDTNNNIAALTSKLFGGTSSQSLLPIDLMEFVNIILPETEGEERMGNEAFAPWYLLQQNYQDWEGSANTLRGYVHNSFKYMKVGLIGHLFKLRGLYVMHFTWLERDRCQKEFDGASRYVDGGCFVLKISGGGWKHLNHHDNAPTELNLAEEKYHLNVHNFFRNVRDCNNDGRMMEHGKYGMGELSYGSVS
ncbi:hypothetical protein DL764_008938 [Monosporascus ibericus]|uniref:Uncharacterized protein n=1 Tax=Monosporascus ibericus TaxID=155417 RepID=A0A4Q4SW74_9PEZI|nr:hypothetical protein DL764_008938 [Monosporascus ibericus]